MAAKTKSKSASHERPLRADAERNRQLILDAAAEAFAERGLGVTMDEIAERAGVGVGTVYRRFPDKGLLIDALFEQKIEVIVEIGERALAIEDPWEALVHFIEEGTAFHAQNRALRELLFSSDAGRRWVPRGRAKMVPIASEIVARAKRSGELRDDIAPFDIPLIELMLAASMDHTDAIDPELWRRLLELVLDGLRAKRNGPTPLSVDPIDADQLADLMRTGPPARRRS